MMRSARMTLRMIIVSVLSFSTSAQLSAQCKYEIVVELENPTCEGGLGIGAAAINDQNVAVGSFAVGCGFDVQPFMWSEETGVVVIPMPPYAYEAEARDINNSGEIVGRLALKDLSGQRAFRYTDGEWTLLPPTGTGIHSEAFGINDDGWVCGYRDTDQGRVAFRWRGELVEEFQPRSGDSAHVNDINDNASAVGQTSGSLQGSQRAFWWVGSKAIEIPPLPGGETSDANALNDKEAVIGTSGHQSAGQRRSWVYRDGKQVDLGLLEPNPRLTALDINNAGQIVGYSSNSNEGNRIQFIWQDGHLIDLGSQIIEPSPDLNSGTANAINNNGWIAVGRIVLRPVDHPLGDVNIDCVVDERDLVDVLDDWGPDKAGHPTDIVTSATFQPPGDGVVDGADLAVVLGNWSSR